MVRLLESVAVAFVVCMAVAWIGGAFITWDLAWANDIAGWSAEDRAFALVEVVLMTGGLAPLWLNWRKS